MADSTLDPYKKWLAIPPEEQPPDHYRLLGVPRFETDLDTIENAADQRMLLVRTFASGPHTAQSQQLLNEIAAAKVVLLDDEKRGAYDAKLREKLKPETPAPQWPAAAPLAESLPKAKPIAPTAPLVTKRAGRPSRRKSFLPQAMIAAAVCVVLLLIAAMAFQGGPENTARGPEDEDNLAPPRRQTSSAGSNTAISNPTNTTAANSSSTKVGTSTDDVSTVAKTNTQPTTSDPSHTPSTALSSSPTTTPSTAGEGRLHPVLKYALRAHPKDAVLYEGHYYQAFLEPMSAEAAQRRCQQMGGYLVCMETTGEIRFLNELYEGRKRMWLGVTNQPDGVWRWINGAEHTGQGWQKGFPADDPTKQLWGRTAEFYWKSAEHDTKFVDGFICEWEF